MDEDRHPAPSADSRRRANVRLGLILAALVLVVFVGFIVKSAIFGI